MEAAQLLRRGFAGPTYETPLQPRRQAAMRFRLLHALSSPDLDQLDPSANRYPKNHLREMSRRLWAGLMPEAVAPPLREAMNLPGQGTTTAVIGAVVLAAAIAWAIVIVVQLPANSVFGTDEDDDPSIQSYFTAAPGSLTTALAAETKTQAADILSAPAGTLPATAPTSEIGSPNSFDPITRPPAASLPAALPSADLPSADLPAAILPFAALLAAPQPSPEVEPGRPEMTMPKAAAASETQPTIALARDEIASLLRRGQDLIAAGDFASARLILTHLAEAGDAEASFILAGTLDPTVIATRRAVSVQPDPAKARAWYARAAEQGSSEAKRRLDQSALR